MFKREEDDENEFKKRKKPKTKTEVDRGGSGMPPRPTAIGLGGYDDDDVNLVRGQILKVKVLDEAVVGFDVEIVGWGVKGLLKTEDYRAQGEVLEASFDSWGPDGTPLFVPFSYKELERLAKREVGDFISDGRETGFRDVFGRVNREHYPFEEDDEKQRFRRAVDLFVPALKTSEVMNHETGPSVFREMIPQMIAIEYTGVLLSSNDQFVSRGGILVYRGRSVGAVYANNFQARVDDSAANLRSVLSELLDINTSLKSYTLPEDIILPYSALFIGSRLERDQESRGQDYANTMIECFEKEAVTGVISLSISFGMETCIVLFNSGVLSGYFLVQERLYSKSADELSEIIAGKNITGIDTRVLHNEILESEKPIGLKFFDYGPKIY